jgi:hypothetical protein
VVVSDQNLGRCCCHGLDRSQIQISSIIE